MPEGHHPSFNRARPLLGCLDFLVEQEFFTADDLENALVAIEVPDDEELPSGVARTVDVIMRFKAAAD